MNFNYDNPRIGFVCSPPFACGQFIVNSISHSKHLIPCLSSETIDILLDNSNDEFKFVELLKCLQSIGNNKNWHYSSLFYDSMRWLCNNEYHVNSMEGGEGPGQIFFDATIEMRQYFDKFWRFHAKKISHMELGFIVKLHYTQEGVGFNNLIPKARWITFNNFRHLQETHAKKQTLGQDMLKHWLQSKYETKGFVIDISAALFSEQSYLKQMQEVYDYLSLDDYKKVEMHLVEYRKAYIRANSMFINRWN